MARQRRRPRSAGRSSSVSVSVEGSDRLLKQLEHVTSRLHQAVRNAVRESAEAVRDGAKRRVHIDTGNLQSSIAVHMDDGPVIKAEIGWKDRDDRYAVWQEFGTRSMPAHPTLGPAFNAEKRKIADRIGDAIRKVIE